MIGVLRSRGDETQRCRHVKEEYRMMTEVGTGVLQAKERQGLRANPQKPGRGKAEFSPTDISEIMALLAHRFWI